MIFAIRAVLAALRAAESALSCVQSNLYYMRCLTTLTVALACVAVAACSSFARNNTVSGLGNVPANQAAHNSLEQDSNQRNANVQPGTHVALCATASGLNYARLRAMHNRVRSAFVTVAHHLRNLPIDGMSSPLSPAIYSMATLLLLKYIVQFMPGVVNQAIGTLAQYNAKYPACVLALKGVYCVTLLVYYGICRFIGHFRNGHRSLNQFYHLILFSQLFSFFAIYWFSLADFSFFGNFESQVTSFLQAVHAYNFFTTLPLLMYPVVFPVLDVVFDTIQDAVLPSDNPEVDNSARNGNNFHAHRD